MREIYGERKSMPDLLRALDNDRSLKAQLLAAYPELADDHDALIDTIDSISDLDLAVVAALRVAVERETHGKALGDLIKQMQERKARLEAGGERIRAVCLHVMQEAGRKRIVAPDMLITVQEGRVGYTVTDAGLVPDDLCKIERTPRMKDIAEAIANGRDVPGVAPRNPRPFISLRRS